MTVERTDIPGPRARRGWDIALSIVLMFLAIGAYLTGAVIALLGIAFFGSCNAGDCSGDTVTTTALVLLVVTIVGIVATIGALILRFRGWWIAAVILGTVIIGWIVSYALSAFGA